MQIDDASGLASLAARGRREYDDGSGEPPQTQAWLMELERARQDAWRCDATPPLELGRVTANSAREAVSAVWSAPTASDADTSSSSAGDRPLRPYGLEQAAETTPTLVSNYAGFTPSNAQLSAHALAATLKISLPARQIFTANPVAAETGATPAPMPVGALRTAPLTHSTTVPHQPSEAATNGDAPRLPSAGCVSSSGSAGLDGASGGDHAPVRLHLEQGLDGTVHAWLGVDKGAEAQAASVVAHWREDLRRRGLSAGLLHINGQAVMHDEEHRAARLMNSFSAMLPAHHDSN